MDKTLYENIFKSSVEGIMVVNDKGIITEANTASEKIFGYNSNELQHLKIENLIPKKYRNIHKQHRENYAKNKEIRQSGKFTALWGLKKDGTEFPMDISLSPTTLNGKNITIAFLRDVSKNRAEHIARLETERKLSTLIGNLPGFAYRCKNDKNFTAEFGSKGVYKITGHKISKFLEGKIHFGQIILEYDKEYTWNTIQKAIEAKKSFYLQYRIITKSGEIKYLWTQGEGIYDTKDNVVALEGFVQDISDNILLKKTLKRKEAKNKALLQALPDMMFITDPKGNFIDFYAPDAKKLTAPKEKIIGKNMKDTLPPKVYSILYETVKHTFNKKESSTVEYHLELNKKEHYFEARLVPLNEHSILTIVRDVTVKKSTENTLQIRNRALGAVGNGILIVDAQQPDLPIIYANKAFTKITGYKHSEVLGKNCRFLQNDDTDQAGITLMRNAIQAGKLCQVTLRNYKKDGTLFYNELTITPIYNNQQELTHFISTNNDVTERKKEELFKNRTANVLKMIALEKSIEHIADKVIEIIKDDILTTNAVVLKLDDDNKTLKRLSTSKLPSFFNQTMGNIHISSDESPCATVALKGKEIIIENLSVTNKWESFSEKLLKEGYKSSWFYPLFSSEQKVIGVLALFSKHIKKTSEFNLEQVLITTNLLSIAIEQEFARDELFQNRKKLADYAQSLEEKVKERTEDLKVTVQQLVETNLTLQDQITETKLAERKALDNQALFLSIAKNFPKGAIAVVNSDYKLIFIEGNELLNFGILSQNLKNVAINDIDILNNDEKNFITESVRRTMAGEHLSIEVKFSEQTYALDTTPFYDENKEINRVLFVFSNISEHKKIELDILNALRKEQELNELKSQFVSLASHEFRTPLSTIMSSATLIKRQNEAGKEEKRLNYVSKIQSNVRILVGILNDFLSLGKLEEGKLTLEPETFDLIDFSKNIIEEIELNKKEGQTLEFIYEMDKLEINQDSKIIRLIFNNLLSNAIKYSPENKNIKISITANKGQVYLQVKDKGMGIPPEEQKQLFKRFFRSKNANHIQGTGLGLYIVKKYTSLMGGNIYFKSNNHDNGSTFFVEFPINNKN